MLKCIIVYKIRNRNTSTLGGTRYIRVAQRLSLFSTYELGKKLMNLLVLPWFDFLFYYKKILPEVGPRIQVF